MDKCICGREKVCSGCKLIPTDCTCYALHEDTGRYSGYTLQKPSRQNPNRT